MTAKQVLQHFTLWIIDVVIIMTCMSFELEIPKHEWAIYIMYFGQGIITGYLWNNIHNAFKKLFNIN